MKNILIMLLALAIRVDLFGQTCNVVVTVSPLGTVCPGTQIQLVANATVTQANQSFNFNLGQLPFGWATTGATNYTNNTCGPSLDGTNYFWASTAGATPQITTAPFDVCSGGNLVFDMRYAVQGGPAPCEGPDLANEGVSIEYSLNGGGTWIEFIYYRPDGVVLPNCPPNVNQVANGNTTLTVWRTYTVPIPAAALSTNTLFRWIQYNSSGGCCDNWGLDNIFINAGPCLNTNIHWSTGEIGVGTINPTVNNDSCFIASVYDDNDIYLCESAPICIAVHNPQINAGPDQSVCQGGTVTLSGSGGNGFVWNNGVVNGVAFVPAATQTYTVTGNDMNGCSASDQVTVTVNPLVVSGFSYAQTDYCNTDADPVAVITGTPGGTFSIAPAGLTIDPVTGALDLSTSTVAPSATYTITYTTPGPCGGPSNFVVSVHAQPTVGAGNDLVVCDGEQVVLTGSGTATTYTWDNGVVDATSFAPPLGTTTYTVTGTTNHGCSNTDAIVVTVNPLPTAVIAGSIDLCQNDVVPVVTFTGANGTAPYTFTYNINGGANQTVISTGNTATLNAPTATAGTFIYNLVSVQDASSTTCSNAQIGVANILINPLPTALITGTTDVCVNATQPVITFTGANGTAPYTFTYNVNGGVSQTVVTTSGNSVTVAVPVGIAGTFVYNLVSVQDASSTTCVNAQVGAATVIVNPLPTATILGTVDVCQNDPQPVITFTGANGTAPYTFTYNVNGGADQTVVSTGNTATVNVSTAVGGTFVYTLVSVQDASSATCLNVQTGTATILVNPLSTATIAGTTDICQNGAQPLITFTGTSGTAPYTFTYNINGGANQTVVTASGNNSITVVVPTLIPGTFVYNLISVQDASSTACSNPQTGSATVLVNPLPTATMVGSTAVCRDAVQPGITFTGANGTAPYTFTYQLNNGVPVTVSTTVGSSVIINVPTNVVGNYSYNLVSVQDASSTTCSNVQVANVMIVVNAWPNVSAGQDFSICSGEMTTLSGSGAVTYVWDNNVVNGVSFIPSDTITYTVIGTDANGCRNTDQITISTVPIPQVDFTAPVVSSCAPLQTSFTNLSTGILNNCVWTFSDGTQFQNCGTQAVSMSNPGCYDVTLTVSTPEGCTNSKTVLDYLCVFANPVAVFNALPAEMTTISTETTMDNLCTGATGFNWNFGDGSGNSSNFEPTHIFPDGGPGNYLVTLVATSAEGCVDTTTRTIRIVENLVYFVPNAFTPDGDNYNQIFKPVFATGVDIYNYSLFIYDRWGEIMFESHDLDFGWDGSYMGKVMQDGVYSWKIEVKELYSDRRRILHGHVSLIR